MKVRWNARSLRLRITPPELETLRAGEAALERMSFGAWRVRVQAGLSSTLEAIGSELRVQLSPADLGALLEPMAEGVYMTQNGFRYYIEKDFPCEHPRRPEVALEPAPESALEPVQTFPRPEQSS